ncbi:MAG TPA: gliding motility-associated ABC transporter substrate-binding protein GldG [Cytophagaceae bacterium]
MSKKKLDIIEISLAIAVIICVNIILAGIVWRADLTEDRRFSLSDYTMKSLETLSDEVYIEVYLAGELNPDYSKLKKSISETLELFKIYGGDNINFRFFDPNSITDKKLREQYYEQLLKKGIRYQYDLVEEGGKKEEKIVFPGALVVSGNKQIPVSFLKGNKLQPLSEQLNESEESIEYELMMALRQLNVKVSKSIAFIEGHGEYAASEVADISTDLNNFYNVNRTTITNEKSLLPYSAVIIAGPDSAYSEKEKFLLDQYIVNGGSALFLIDPLNLNHDSLVSGKTFAFPYKLELDDMLFKYGVRLNPVIVQDLNAGLLRAQAGEAGKFEMVNWPYFPIVYNFSKHPIVKSLDAIKLKYISTIDTTKSQGIKKTPLIFTSANTKVAAAPLMVELNEIKNSTKETFNGGVKTLAYLLEGKFTSNYSNRPSPISGAKVQSQNKAGKIIVVADADIIRNDFDRLKGKPIPLGYDADIQYQFSNKDFLINSIDYLASESIVDIKSKEIKLRPLDKIRIAEERNFWQVLNIAGPIALLLIAGIAAYFVRKNRFEKHVDQP